MTAKLDNLLMMSFGTSQDLVGHSVMVSRLCNSMGRACQHFGDPNSEYCKNDAVVFA